MTRLLPALRPRRAARRLRLAALAPLSVLAACITVSNAPEPPNAGIAYDVVITNGRLVDGTGNPWTYADVGIVGDRIVRIAPRGALVGATAKKHVDATGLVVAPGFIDIQAQSYDALLTGDGRSLSKVTQGVTTEILGEGTTPAPVNATMLAAFAPADSAERRVASAFLGRHGFGAWLNAMGRHANTVNSGSFLGAATVREYAMARAQGAPDPARLDTMRRVVQDAMRDGAFGIASALIYPPGSYATTGELIAMAQAMAPYHGVYISHIRSEEDSLLEAIDEALRIGKDGGVPVEIYHLKAAGPRNWKKAPLVIAKIDSARAAGQDVGATMYPYSASGNNLSSCIPPWAAENGKLLDNLRDPASRARIEKEIVDTTPGAPQFCQVYGSGAIMVVGLHSPDLVKYEGWRLERIATAMQKPWPTALVDIVLAENDRVGKISFSMSEENVRLQLRQPWVVIGTDAESLDPDSAKELNHPRAYGSYPKILGLFVRQEHLFPLEEAIRKMSSAVAAVLSLRDRGLIAEGMYADIVIFDPATIIDRATFEKPHQLSTGVRDVFVNGVQVLANGGLTSARPGRVVRGPGYLLP